MIDREKLENILHREEIDKLQGEIDELPDYYSGWNDSFNNMCNILHSDDLKNSKVHLTQTAWKDKYLEPNSTLTKYQSRQFDLNILKYAHIIWATTLVLFCFALLYICADASMP